MLLSLAFGGGCYCNVWLTCASDNLEKYNRAQHDVIGHWAIYLAGEQVRSCRLVVIVNLHGWLPRRCQHLAVCRLCRLRRAKQSTQAAIQTAQLAIQLILSNLRPAKKDERLAILAPPTSASMRLDTQLIHSFVWSSLSRCGNRFYIDIKGEGWRETRAAPSGLI